MSTSTTRPKPSPRQGVWRMFDRIAPRYDLLNRLLSFGRDMAWRRALVRHLPSGSDLLALDLATGTADMLLLLGEGGVRRGIGLDPSAGMLNFAQNKIRRRQLLVQLGLVRGDATRLGFGDCTFDVITVAFGIRNMADVAGALREMERVLRPGGRALILEFSMTENRLFRGVYLAYFRHVLPRIGGWISGDRDAYRYLNRTVEAFPYGETFAMAMRAAGFREVTVHPLSFGIATIYIGEKAGKTHFC